MLDVTCEWCGKKIDSNESVGDDEGNFLCDECQEQFKQNCKGCGKEEHIFNMAGVDDDGNPFCDDCIKLNCTLRGKGETK